MLADTLNSDIIAAMKAKDATRLIALRMLKTAMTNRSIEKGQALDEGEERQVVATLVKQRRDSVEQFTAGGRTDLADKERAEIAVLEAYLPPAVTQEEVDAAVTQAITETGASGAKDIGKVMKAAMAALAGKTVDGKQVNQTVRARLS